LEWVSREGICQYFGRQGSSKGVQHIPNHKKLKKLNRIFHALSKYLTASSIEQRKIHHSHGGMAQKPILSHLTACSLMDLTRHVSSINIFFITPI
jgi:hypothetical protein